MTYLEILRSAAPLFPWQLVAAWCIYQITPSVPLQYSRYGWKLQKMTIFCHPNALFTAKFTRALGKTLVKQMG